MSTFKTTNWAEVHLARDRTTAEGASAFARLIALYSPALLNHLVHNRRLPKADAEDVLHQFVVDKLIEREVLARVDRSRGRFRTFLLGILDNYVVDWHRRSQRSGNALAELVQSKALTSHDEVDAFELGWAESVVAEALALTCRYFEATGRQAYWELFQRRVVDPAYNQGDDIEYTALVTDLGFPNPRAASAAIITVKRALRRHLETLLGDTPEEAAMELDDLTRILGRRAIAASLGRR